MKILAMNAEKQFPRKRDGDLLTAVRKTTFQPEEGKVTVITGRSGSGKSTLLNMMAGMLVPTEGSVLLDGTNLYSLPDEALSRLRNEKIGLIPQGHTALLSLTVKENILLPGILYGKAADEEAAEELMEKVGILDLKDAMPNELSGGELRRMAAARALCMRPGVILADEPTAGLDEENIRAVMRLLRESADNGCTVLVVTHEPEAEEYADRVFDMDRGTLEQRK